jgi:hypothetical protein
MATRKMKRYAEGDIVEGENPNIDDETRARARKFVEDNADKEESMPRFTPKSAAPAKSKMVTKEELAKSGMSLRDYMNKQQGLTRKGGSSAPDTGDEADRLASRFKKPPLRQETMRERAESFNAKRFAQKAEDAAKSTMPRGQDRILTGIKKKTDENKFMGSIGMKSGGSVSSASKRADGIAIKGKTRGKMC